jgi:hypothetical protein
VLFWFFQFDEEWAEWTSSKHLEFRIWNLEFAKYKNTKQEKYYKK